MHTRFDRNYEFLFEQYIYTRYSRDSSSSEIQLDLDLLIAARNISRIYIYIDSTRRSWDPGGEKQLVSFHPSLDCCGPSASIFVSSLTFFDGHEFSSQFSSRDVNEPFDTLGGGSKREREWEVT